MNDKSYRWVLYVIVAVIITTICIQVYWNYRNYLASRQQLINDVQISLDNAVDSYFTKLVKVQTSTFEKFRTSKNGSDHKKILIKNASTLHSQPLDSFRINYLTTKKVEDITIIKITGNDSINERKKTDSSMSLRLGKIDSAFPQRLKALTSKVFFSITNDSLLLGSIDTLLTKELTRKKIDVTYGLSYSDILYGKQVINKQQISPASLSTSSKSAYLPPESKLNIHFSNTTFIIFKRILTGILISTILVLAIISCLFYLLKIIKHQKQLSTVKNDLISNITHEFKTPIATIAVALESIRHFDGHTNAEKTKDYLAISTSQLKKLNTMVEKLLETASLDSGQLQLVLESTDLVNQIQTTITKYQLTTSKEIGFSTSNSSLFKKIDVFHFDNAINNILDNAIKYGGDIISISIILSNDEFIIQIKDNGRALGKNDATKIFEQFYRIPKGNTHDVKGFGIGLYYAKKIIEKHNGTISLLLKNKETNFKIVLPRDNTY